MRAIVERIIEWSPSVRSIFFRPEKKIDFVAGQFVMLSLPAFPHKRAYSLANGPGSEVLEVAVKKTPEGKLSPKLFELQKGDELLCDGPFGNFRLDGAQKKISLIAGGTGIAPLMSMIRSLAAMGWPAQVNLVYGSFEAENLLYLDELRSYEKHVRLLLVVENPHESWTGERGRITQGILEKGAEKDSIFYLCGPPAMIKAIEALLQSWGIDKDAIKTDKWD